MDKNGESMNVIWYAWVYLPNGYKGVVKIEHYNKLEKVCVITFSGDLTMKNVPAQWLHPINGCTLPWEAKNDSC